MPSSAPLAWVTPSDWAALVWFFVSWVGYTLFADYGPGRHRSIAALMTARRRSWFMECARRDLRIIDTNILGNLLQGVSFLSSTTIFAIGGLLAMMGVTDKVAQALGRLPFVEDSSLEALESKICFLLIIFVYAFFKFGWAFRLTNYCSITMGGLPSSSQSESERVRYIVGASSILSTRSGHHFNRGLRAYFFALGALGWLVHPVLFAIISCGVVVVLYRREFSSTALRALGALDQADPAPPPLDF